MEAEKMKTTRQKRRALIKKRGGQCKSRSKTSHRGPLHFAHTKKTGVHGRGRGSYARYMDARDNPGSYTLLCEKHNRARDRNVRKRKK